jgi:branched-chain amino acid transport system substrate-binding protein
MKTGNLIGFATMTLVALGATCADAQDVKISDGVVRIGFMTDFNGPFSTAGGTGSVDAVKMAIEDFGGTVLGKPIELIQADHQNKPDIGLATAREWIEDKHVDVIMDISNSAIALAIQNLAQDKKVIVLNTGAGTSDFTGKACSPHGIAWTYDTYALAAGVAKAVIKQGGDTWFFVTVDYNFGKALEQDMRSVVLANGGKILGAVKHPLLSPDLSSQLLEAKASGAKVIGLANGATDARNAVKQARQFGVTPKQQLAAALLVMTDIRALGLEDAQGVKLVEAFYWDLDDATRAFSERFYKRNGKMPTMMQAGNYSAAFAYLAAIKQAGTDDPDVVVKTLKATDINDFMTKHGHIREDGRMIRDMYLFQVKSPSESKGEWDLYNLLATIPGEDAARPLSEGGCPLVAK